MATAQSEKGVDCFLRSLFFWVGVKSLVCNDFRKTQETFSAFYPQIITANDDTRTRPVQWQMRPLAGLVNRCVSEQWIVGNPKSSKHSYYCHTFVQTKAFMYGALQYTLDTVWGGAPNVRYLLSTDLIVGWLGAGCDLLKDLVALVFLLSDGVLQLGGATEILSSDAFLQGLFSLDDSHLYLC